MSDELEPTSQLLDKIRSAVTECSDQYNLKQSEVIGCLRMIEAEEMARWLGDQAAPEKDRRMIGFTS